MSMDTKPLVRTPGLTERDLGDAVVVLAADGSQLHTLKGSGLLLWRHIDGRATVADLAAALVAEYEVDLARAQTDSRAFSESLRTLGLIEA